MRAPVCEGSSALTGKRRIQNPHALFVATIRVLFLFAKVRFRILTDVKFEVAHTATPALLRGTPDRCVRHASGDPARIFEADGERPRSAPHEKPRGPRSDPRLGWMSVLRTFDRTGTVRNLARCASPHRRRLGDKLRAQDQDA